MKIRTGFVSNSSSSSFIIGVGKLNNKKKFEEYCLENKLKIDGYDIIIYTTSELMKQIGKGIVKKINDKLFLEIESFNYNTVSMNIDPSKEELYICIDISNDEGDHCFCNYDEEDYEPNYDIDISFLPENQQKLFSLCNNNGVKKLYIEYGAARNG